jgi:hypothetical protein
MKETTFVTMRIHGLGPRGKGASLAEIALSRVPGVSRAYVNPVTEMAYAEYDPTCVCPEDLIEAVESVAGWVDWEPLSARVVRLQYDQPIALHLDRLPGDVAKPHRIDRFPHSRAPEAIATDGEISYGGAGCSIKMQGLEGESDG